MNVFLYIGMFIVVVMTFILSWHYYHPSNREVFLSQKEACLQSGGTSVEHHGKFERCIPGE